MNSFLRKTFLLTFLFLFSKITSSQVVVSNPYQFSMSVFLESHGKMVSSKVILEPNQQIILYDKLNNDIFQNFKVVFVYDYDSYLHDLYSINDNTEYLKKERRYRELVNGIVGELLNGTTVGKFMNLSSKFKTVNDIVRGGAPEIENAIKSYIGEQYKDAIVNQAKSKIEKAGVSGLYDYLSAISTEDELEFPRHEELKVAISKLFISNFTEKKSLNLFYTRKKISSFDISIGYNHFTDLVYYNSSKPLHYFHKSEGSIPASFQLGYKFATGYLFHFKIFAELAQSSLFYKETNDEVFLPNRAYSFRSYQGGIEMPILLNQNSKGVKFCIAPRYGYQLNMVQSWSGESQNGKIVNPKVDTSYKKLNEAMFYGFGASILFNRVSLFLNYNSTLIKSNDSYEVTPQEIPFKSSYLQFGITYSLFNKNIFINKQ